MCCFLPSSDKSVWGAVYYFFHFLSLLPPHPGQRTKLGFWWQLLSLTWHLYFNLIFSATQQRLNHSSARLERGCTERDSLEAEVFYLLADGSSIETGYWFFFLNCLLFEAFALPGCTYPSQKSHADRWCYQPVICLPCAALFHLNPQRHCETHLRTDQAQFPSSSMNPGRISTWCHYTFSGGTMCRPLYTWVPRRFNHQVPRLQIKPIQRKPIISVLHICTYFSYLCSINKVMVFCLYCLES